VSPGTTVELGKYCAEHNKVLAVNIAAPFLVQYYWDKMEAVLPYADYVLANEEEAKVLLDKLGFDNSNIGEEVMKKVSELPKVNTKRSRTVIFTQGSEPVLTYHNGVFAKFEPTKISKEAIVDTNGAGDAWAGGFLCGLCHDKPFEECIRAGMYAALQILQVSGTQYPSTCNFKWEK